MYSQPCLMFMVPLEHKNFPILSHHIFKLRKGGGGGEQSRENKEILRICGLQMKETSAKHHMNLLLKDV